MSERELCQTCHGNGSIPIRHGISVCPACKGHCWACASGQAMSDERPEGLSERLLRAVNTASHTPGPWTLLHAGADGAFEIAVNLDPTGDCFDALIIAKRSQVTHRAEESCANARLIAAAPDLLAALKVTVDRHNASAQHVIGRDCQCPDCRRFQPLIAKAEGR